MASDVTIDAETMQCCMALGYGAHDTIGNAEAANWMKSSGHRSMILVTSNYHMARSRLEFHAAMPDITIIEYPVLPTDPGRVKWCGNHLSRVS